MTTNNPESPVLEPSDMTDDELKAAIRFHETEAAKFKNEAAKIWRLRIRLDGGIPEDKRRLAELHARRAARPLATSAAPRVDKDDRTRCASCKHEFCQECNGLDECCKCDAEIPPRTVAERLSQHEQIEVIEGVLGGVTPLVSRSRISVHHILSYLYNGESINYIAENYQLTPEAVKDAIAFAQDVYDDAIDSALRTPAAASPAAPEEEANALVDEVQHRMDQVVEAAVEWHQAGREGAEWFEAAEKLGAAINSLLELRGEPSQMPRRYCSVHNREEFKYESLEHELHAATSSSQAGTIETHLGELPFNLIDEIHERRSTLYAGLGYRSDPDIAARMKTDLDYLMAFVVALRHCFSAAEKVPADSDDVHGERK